LTVSLPLARRYAQALYEICQESNEQEAVFADMTALSAALAESDELRGFIGHRALTRKQQEEILQALFKKKIGDTSMIFLLFLVNKSRLHILGQICEAFEEAVLASRNIVKATIISSTPLDERQLAHIKKHLAQTLNKEIREKVTVDPSLIGGVKVRIGDEIYDYTLRTQLEEFRLQFNKVA
jgi:F-type H+-transporting ATPase subunit delta